jgi:hypothetical protein
LISNPKEFQTQFANKLNLILSNPAHAQKMGIVSRQRAMMFLVGKELQKKLMIFIAMYRTL